MLSISDPNTRATRLRTRHAAGLIATLSLTLGACASSSGLQTTLATAASANTPAVGVYPSTYTAPAAPPTLIRGATVLIGNGERLDNADVLLQDGVIQAVGLSLIHI